MGAYTPRVKTSFGLPEIGEKSKIGINRKNDKVIYVKKNLKNKIDSAIWDTVFIIGGIGSAYIIINK